MPDYNAGRATLHALYSGNHHSPHGGFAEQILELIADELPIKLPALTVQMTVTGPPGPIQATCEIFRPGARVGMIESSGTNSIGPTGSLHIIFTFGSLTFPAAGDYEVRAWINLQEIKVTTLPVRIQPKSPFGDAPDRQGT